MLNLGAKPCRRQVLAYGIGHGHGAVLAARASKRNSQVALAFTDVMGNEVDQQLGDPLQELNGLRKRLNVLGDLRVASGEMAELRDVVRVRQKAHIEDQIAIGRDSMAVSEAG